MSWVCPKCGCDSYTTDQFQATGGTITKLLDIQNKKFSTITCTRCRFTEMYQADSSQLENILDLLIGK